MKKDSFDKEVEGIISNLVGGVDIREPAYIPDINKFTDWLKFCELHPGGSYSQFKKYCQEEEVKER